MLHYFAETALRQGDSFKGRIMGTLYLGDIVPDFEQDTSIGRIRLYLSA
jgi:hypothetical protein